MQVTLFASEMFAQRTLHAKYEKQVFQHQYSWSKGLDSSILLLKFDKYLGDYCMLKV